MYIVHRMADQRTICVLLERLVWTGLGGHFLHRTEDGTMTQVQVDVSQFAEIMEALQAGKQMVQLDTLHGLM